MEYASQHIKATVLLDSTALKKMGFIEMVNRIEQMSATGRYSDIRIDYPSMQILADVIA